MSGIQGGNFWAGFASGAISSIASTIMMGGSTYEYGMVNGKEQIVGEITHKGLLSSNQLVGTLAAGAISGGAGAALAKGNFWQGAVTGLMVAGLNHLAHQVQIKNEIESKYPRLYKTLSKLRSFVKKNENILNSLSETSGYTPKKVLKLLSAKNLASILTVDEQGDWGHFSSSNPSKISIRASLIRGLEKVKLPENLNGTSFFAGVTVLHEFVHYGRYWNGLSGKINIKGTYYEAGQVFETNAFGRILDINGNSEIISSNGWKF